LDSLKALRKAGAHQKGDERKYRLAAEGFSLKGAGARVAELLSMTS